MNTRKLGTDWEQYAAEYLTKQGMRIVEKNFRCGKTGEIDLIGYHKGYLVFIEVKYRGNLNSGAAVEAVGHRKQRQICKTADYYRFLHHVGDGNAVRYDVVAIQGKEVFWIQNAFAHIYVRNYS